MARPFIASAGLFSISLAMGYEADPSIKIAMMGAIREFVGPLAGLSSLQLMLLILANNGIKSFLAIVLGLGLGVVPFIYVVGNGFMLGVVASEAVALRGIAFTAAALLPHGFIELPALLASAAAGLKIGLEVLKRMSGREGQVRGILAEGVSLYVRRILPALVLASFVEVFITPLVVGMVQ